MLSALFGPSLITKVLFIFCFLVAGSVFIVTLFTVIYQRVIYGKMIRPRFNTSYQPRCSVIIPCKGTTKDFENNLRAFCTLDYANYEVLYAVESADDAAVPVINNVLQDHKHASLVVAGLTKTCAQKNFNQIAAVGKTNDPEILVFADGDIGPKACWLKELILPLSDKSISVSTGFRWLHAEKRSLAQQTHFFMNSFLYALYCFASFTGSVGLWGGSMAIRKKDFDDMNVIKRWSETVVDDSSLSELIKKNHKKSMLVTTCITHTNDLISNVWATTRWFERQMMFLKAYQKSLWLASMPIITISLLLIVWLPFAAILALTTSYGFSAIGGMAALSLLVGMFLSDMFYPLLGPTPRFGTFMVLQPISFFMFLFSCFKTMFTNTVTWSGYKYKVAFFSGKVTNIKRF